MTNKISGFFFQQIRDIIVRNLRITREVPIMRVKRNINGMEVRGCKPITVYFEKWQDKDDILRKSNMLRGHNIFIGEDFSKRVRDQVIIIVLLFIFVNQSIGSNFTMKIYFFRDKN